MPTEDRTRQAGERIWRHRYAPHLGYRSPDQPLLRYSAGSVDPVSQVNCAAELGFAGVQYAWAAARPEAQRRAVANAIADRGLEAGCVVWAAPEVIRRPLWGRLDQAARDELARELAAAIDASQLIGATTIAVLGVADADSPIGPQRAAMVENLRWAGDLVQQHGMVLGLEPMVSFPNMLSQSCADGVELLQTASHPAVRLIFDTGHVHAVDGDVLRAFQQAREWICLVQFADQPDRVEPGAGVIDFGRLLGELSASGYRGLIELEHGWLSPGLEGERLGLERLRALDAADGAT